LNNVNDHEVGNDSLREVVKRYEQKCLYSSDLKRHKLSN